MSPLLPDLTLFKLLDYSGVTVFAATGVLVAARKKHDIVTFIFFAIVTGVGGGTLRDLLINVPVFWIRDDTYLVICALTAIALWFVDARSARSLQALLWLDAIGLAAYAVLGASKALDAGLSAPIAVAMGVLTGSFGGIVRDVLAGEPSVLLRREIYITAGLAGSIVFVALTTITGLPAPVAGATGFAAALCLRAIALRFELSLPGYRQGRDS